MVSDERVTAISSPGNMSLEPSNVLVYVSRLDWEFLAIEGSEDKFSLLLWNISLSEMCILNSIGLYSFIGFNFLV